LQLGSSVKYDIPWAKVNVQFLDSNSNVVSETGVEGYSGRGDTYKDVGVVENIKKIKYTFTDTGRSAVLMKIYVIGFDIQEPTCNDPDGDNRYLKSCGTGTTNDGTVYTESNPLCDSCDSDGVLKEVQCGYENYLVVSRKARTVGDICVDGAYVKEVTPTGACTDYHGKKADCMAQNTIPSSSCEWKSKEECDANINCKWYAELAGPFGGFGVQTGKAVKDITGEPVSSPPSGGQTGLSPCRPVTKCVYTKEHCCSDGKKWDNVYNICKESSDLCYSFRPGNKEEGK